MSDENLTKEQTIELIMDQFQILYEKAAADAGWTEIPEVVDDAMDEAYRLLRASISDTENPTGQRRPQSAA